MSFSTVTKNELARFVEVSDCCRLAELAALIKTNGILKISGNKKVSLSIMTENAAVARKIILLCKALFQVTADVIALRRAQLKKNNTYAISIFPNVLDILSQTGLFSGSGELTEGIDKGLITRDCCRRSYLRGIFLGCGTLNDPGTGYHLEMILSTRLYAREIFRLLRKLSFHPGLITRKNGYAVYFKEAEQIVNFLRFISAYTAVLNIENVRIYKEMRNQINRLVNCETANLSKTINASLKQQKMIQFLAATIGLEQLPPLLKQIAEVRLSHPEASLKELGELLSPKVGKSGVKHRLHKLEEIARNYQNKEGKICYNG